MRTARSNFVSSPRKLVSGNPPTRCHRLFAKCHGAAGAGSRRAVRTLFQSEERRRRPGPRSSGLRDRCAIRPAHIQRCPCRMGAVSRASHPDRRCSRHRRRPRSRRLRRQIQRCVHAQSVRPRPSSCSFRRGWQPGWDISTLAASSRSHVPSVEPPSTMMTSFGGGLCSAQGRHQPIDVVHFVEDGRGYADG